MSGASEKTLGGIEETLKNFGTKEPKKQNSLEDMNQSTKEQTTKRGYHLKNSTIKKLEELKLYHYDVNVSLGDIVDEAICLLYKTKKGE